MMKQTTTAVSAGRRRFLVALLASAVVGLSAFRPEEARAGSKNGGGNV